MHAWCDWCYRHALPCLPADPADVVAFLAAERGRGLSVTTIELRRAAIRYLHLFAGCPVPTADSLRDIPRAIPDDLPGLRDRALLLLGLPGRCGAPS